MDAVSFNPTPAEDSDMATATISKREADEPRTVKVKLLTSRAVQRLTADGKPAGFIAQAVGDIVEMEPDEAQRNIDAGLARAA